ncbi:MAG: hypothetical protein AAF797_03825 [Planctomycetota bacterium]
MLEDPAATSAEKLEALINTGVMHCPEAPTVSTASLSNITFIHSYGRNGYYSGPWKTGHGVSNGVPYDISLNHWAYQSEQVSSASETFNLVDGHGPPHAAFLSEFNPDQPRPPKDPDLFMYRHGDVANMLLVDGHVDVLQSNTGVTIAATISNANQHLPAFRYLSDTPRFQITAR